MTKRQVQETADIREQTVYQTGNILYVPHYLKKDIYVAPGNIEYQKKHLDKKAIKTTLMLWTR